MTDISNPNLRPKDIRKIVANRFQFLEWEQGYESKNEWVFASTSTQSHRNKLRSWLQTKCIAPENAVVVVESNWHSAKKSKWSIVLAKPENMFASKSVDIYDSKLDWVLEYRPQEVARFGRFKQAGA